MTKSAVQFHALPDELCRFVSELARESGLRVTAAWKGQGFKVTPKDRDLLDLVAANGTPNWIFVTAREPLDGEYGATQDFLRANPGTLSIDVGQLNQSGLDQSYMGFLTADEDAAQRWRKVIDRLKSRTRSGAKTRSIVTGLTGVNKSHRYTAAAQELAQKGVTMWALGRKTVFEFPESTRRNV